MIPKLMGSEVEYNVHLIGVPERFRYDDLYLSADYWLPGCIVAKGGELRGVTMPYASSAVTKWFNWWELAADEEDQTEHARAMNQRLGMSGWRLSNGARFYLDNFFPEYSTPECLSVMDLIRYEKAGERSLEIVRRAFKEDTGIEVKVFKKNSDRKGASYACHENYLLTRAFFDELVRPSYGGSAAAWTFATFLATRVIFAGSGKVGFDKPGGETAYQLSQRADFIETFASIHTTCSRPILNLRDVPYADSRRFGRLHVIAGDSNMAETSIFLKMGTTAMVLAMLEDGWLEHRLPKYVVKDPVSAIKIASRDLEFCMKLMTVNNTGASSLEIQHGFLNDARDWYEKKYVPEHGKNVEYDEILALWLRTLEMLRRDPLELSTELDCWVKKMFVEQMLAEAGYSLNDVLGNAEARDLALSADYLYHSVDETESNYAALVREGFIERLLSEEEIKQALVNPPENTRAYLRGRLISRLMDLFGVSLDIWASWHGISVSISNAVRYERPLLEIRMPDPFRGAKSDIEAIFASESDIRVLGRRIKEVL
jgi:proteasome accessory factor A